MRPVMLATDGSPSAEAAKKEALEFAKRTESPLLVVSVAHESAPLYGYYGYAEISAEMRKADHERICDLFEKIEREAREAGVACETLELQGLVGDELCRAARERGARMIVVGAHGWGRVGRLVHGSVSTYLLHHATAPVLVVKAGTPAEAETLAA